MQVFENEILVRKYKDDYKNAKHLRKMIDYDQYPPRMLLDIHCKEQGTCHHCDITVCLSGVQQRGHSNPPCICFHVDFDLYSGIAG